MTSSAEAAGGPIAHPRQAGRLKVLPEALVASVSEEQRMIPRPV